MVPGHRGGRHTSACGPGRALPQPPQIWVDGLGGLDVHPRVHHVVPSGPAMTGLRSSSATWGRSSASRATRSSRSCSAGRSAGGAPRCPSSSGAARTERISVAASVSVSGVSRAVRSSSTSVATPPRPKTTSGPKTGSLHHPDDHLRAAGNHGLDDGPGHARGRTGRPARGSPPVPQPRPCRSSWTAPASLLCTRPGDLGLEHDRAAELVGHVGRRLLAGHQPRGDLG